MDVKQTIQTLLRDGFILVFNLDQLDVVKTAEALVRAGVNNMEVTCRIRQPLKKLERLRKKLPDFVVGVASLIDRPSMLQTYNETHQKDPLPSLEHAVDAGASFLVSAGTFRDESYRKLADKVAMVPGCGSVSEIISQFSMGANLCKIFPAKQLGGPGFVKAIDPAIHKTISLVPMGGTNPTNIPDYVEAGVLVLGGSFSMIAKATMEEIVEEQNYNLLASELRTIKQQIDALRADQYPDLELGGASLEEITKVTGRNFNLPA